MFKNYLTHQFALHFERQCSGLTLSEILKSELGACAHNVLIYFERSLRTQDRPEELRNVAVALLYLRECETLLRQAQVEDSLLWSRYAILQGRFEKICEKLAQDEGGQLRLFG